MIYLETVESLELESLVFVTLVTEFWVCSLELLRGVSHV